MRHFLTLMLSILFSATLVADACAIEHPRWKELAKLLGRPTESDEVRAFSKKYELTQYHKFDQGGFVAPDNSFSLLFRKNRISTIVIRVAPLPKGSGAPNWKPFSQPLPGGLQATDSPRDIVAKLGAPVKDQKNRWRFEDLVIWVHFADDGKTIAELFISFRPEK